VPTAVIAFDFDPYLRLGETALRWETLALAGTILLALLIGARLAGSFGSDAGWWGLRRLDLLFIVLGVVPGAIIGGRAGYVLLHLDYYAANPAAILDPAQGGLQLSLGVVGGAVTGAYVARYIDAPVGRWLHIAAVPVLAALVLGKVAMALGGTGQGEPASDPWATAYLGPWPWGSLAPDVPSHPAQIYEAALSGLALAALLALLSAGAFRRRDGLAFLVGVALWAIGRLVVASSWRDPLVAGPLRADQLISLVVLAGCIGLFVLRVRRRPAGDGPGGEEEGGRAAGEGELHWPDPAVARDWRAWRRSR
jgi:phosphatidylglycerol:prolipoprotein diacylglycerol transferase